jgi:hypothetical protein
MDNPDDPKGHELWPYFAQFAAGNGIGLEDQGDWIDWWNCFIAGAGSLAAIALVRLTRNSARS